LLIATRTSERSTAAAGFSRVRSVRWSRALVTGLISLAASQSALGDIYKWTDAQGNTNFSNLPPSKSERAANVAVVAKESGPVRIGERTANPTEQELLARIRNLEGQLQSRQTPAPTPQTAPQAAPPPVPYAGNYPVTPAPAPQNYYDNGYDSGYYPAYYPTYYYPVLPLYAYAAFPRRGFVARPGFNPGFRGSFRGGGGHRGRH